MKIHSDLLTKHDLYAHLPSGCNLELTECGSRKRDHAFNVGIGANHGHDKHGIKRVFARNTGQYGSSGDYDRAATWVEWGDWIVDLFQIDPDAIIGTYKGASDFVAQTTQAATWRPERENAQEHAERWSKALYYGVPA